jgi:hypothetical protein
LGQIAAMVVFFFIIMNSVFMMMGLFATDIGQTNVSTQFTNANFSNSNYTTTNDDLLNTRNFTIAAINYTGSLAFFDPVLDAVDRATLGIEYIVRFITLGFIIDTFASFTSALGMEFPEGFNYVLYGVGGFLFFDFLSGVLFNKTILPF